MRLVFLRSLGLLALSLILSHIAQGEFQSSSSVSNSHPSQDEAALYDVVDKYFSAYGQKVLAGVVSLWSEKSPDLATYKQRLQQQFTNEGLSFGSPAISRVIVESEKARLRVTIALASIDLKSRKKSEQRLVSNLELVKEGGAWRIWRYVFAAEDLAAALVKTDGKTEREALLATDSELVTAELVQEILAQGRRLFNHGSFDRAKEVAELAMEVAERCGDKSSIARSLLSIGFVHSSQGNYAEALERYQQSLKISEKLGDKSIIARTLNNIGIAYRLQGNYTEALEQYQKSLKISEDLGDKSVIASSRGNIGVVHQLQGNYIEALEQFQKSLKISEELGDKAFIAGALVNIGIIHDLQGNYAQALEQYQTSIKISEELGNKAFIGRILNNIGGAYRSQGNYTEALEQFQKSLKISEEIGSKTDIAVALSNIGETHRAQGNYAQALEQYQKSLKIREEIGDKDGIASSLTNIGDIQNLQGNHMQALQFCERAADLAKRIGIHDVLWRPHLNAGRAYFALGQFARARQSFDAAIASIETIRGQVAGGGQEQQRFFESRIEPYQAMVELLVAQKNLDEALIYAERARARVLLDVLSSGRVNITKAMTGPEVEQEHQLKSRLVALNTQVYREKQGQQPDQDRLDRLESQLQKARRDFETFQTDLYLAHPELKPRRGEAPVIKAEEIAALLPDAKSALLEYVVTDDRTYLFAITKSAGKPEVEVRVYALPIKRAELAMQTENFRKQLAGRDLGFYPAARQLYQLLLNPAHAQIRGKTNLMIVPDDKLWELPFQALVAAGGRYVIETSAVSYVPSLTVLREMKAQHNKHRDDIAGLALLALGNPSLGPETIERATIALRDDKLDPLPEAEQEVKALGRFYGASRSKVYIGKEAREDRVKSEAGEAGILHFATHGTLNNPSPMYSHLVLAQGGANEDGLLEAWELMEMDLKAELAVLSACETARGRYGAGEGMIGLTWALFVAGVPATVVSQWKVESAGTRDLMMGFHRELRGQPEKTRMSKTEALRLAALRLMENPATNHPFYWAGFVLVGDDN